MFDHVSLGVRDIARSRRFYDSALAPLGFVALSDADDSLGYGKDAVALWLSLSASPVPADPRSGLHFCFKAPSRPAVGEFHRAGLAAGGSDNGAPGLRADYGPTYYAAYVVDPDGYRLEALCDKEA
ncbi:MAG: VOC family protein [Roseiarcus sp.]|jgi:catechol 2,3-dioxygenase-like lactoylglutathione lyase family enzyme